VRPELLRVSVKRYLAVALSGAAYEACSVVWVHSAEHGTALATALVSGLQALAQVVGIGESARDWRCAPFFVVGYAVGAYVAMRVS
jgi:hypothetical protein